MICRMGVSLLAISAGSELITVRVRYCPRSVPKYASAETRPKAHAIRVDTRRFNNDEQVNCTQPKSIPRSRPLIGTKTQTFQWSWSCRTGTEPMAIPRPRHTSEVTVNFQNMIFSFQTVACKVLYFSSGGNIVFRLTLSNGLASASCAGRRENLLKFFESLESGPGVGLSEGARARQSRIAPELECGERWGEGG